MTWPSPLGWNPLKRIVGNLKDAAVETGIALYDEGRAGLAMAAYSDWLEGIALGLQATAEFAEGDGAARGADGQGRGEGRRCGGQAGRRRRPDGARAGGGGGAGGGGRRARHAVVAKLTAGMPGRRPGRWPRRPGQWPGR